MGRIRAAAAVVGLAALSILAVAPSADAITVGSCPVIGSVYHQWGQQWAYGDYYGQFGWLETFEPSVPDYQHTFSLSHLYSYYGNSNPSSSNANTFVEVGFVKGQGLHMDYTSSHFYYAWADHGTYHEFDSTSAPTNGHTYSYEVLFSGHNYSMGTDDWQVYWNGLGTVRGTVHESSMPYSHALAGGEVAGEFSQSTEMHTHGEPDQQIISENYAAHNWTTYFTSTHACESSNINYTISSDYMDFTATGSV